MKRRMHRLLHADGRVLVVAMDHTSFLDTPAEGLARYGDTVRTAVAAGADAFLSPVGSLIAHADAYGPAAAVASVDTTAPFGEAAVERALAAGADGVKCMVFPFADDDSVARAYRLAADAARVGLPFVAEPIPGGWTRGDLRTPAAIAAGARVAGETGADLVKTFYTGDPESMRRVVAYAGAPVIVLGGSTRMPLRELFGQVFDAVVVAGCAGVAIGTNIWSADDPGGVVRGLAAILHADASVEQALKVAEAS